jgi:two-component system OmpR family response regulator
MSKANILLVEDEKNFGLVMRDYLQMNGYTVTWMEDGLLGFSAFQNKKHDLCIIDVMMPKMDGFTLTEEIRKENKIIPIVFLTARSMREDMLKGYRAGADDYIVKPFDTEVLLLKLDSILKRTSMEAEQKEQVAFSVFLYDHNLRMLKDQKGKQQKLSPKESDLLNILLQNVNKAVPRSLLLTKIWKEDNYFTGRSMDVYIAKLRKYLESDSSVSIENIHSSGYCLRCTSLPKSF